MELSVFSMATLLLNLCGSDELARVQTEGAFAGWSAGTILPVLSTGAR
jgi:hypothetical protein